jgi:hypothetical protein
MNSQPVKPNPFDDLLRHMLTTPPQPKIKKPALKSTKPKVKKISGK